MPTIAVVIAAKNAANLIGETLQSLADQTRPPDEIVIFDDGSDDGTTEVADRFREKLPMLNLLRSESSLGISAARNRGNDAVTSDYIAVLDADDLFAPETIERYGDFILRNREVDLVYADTKVFKDSPELGLIRRYPEFSSPTDAVRRTLGTPLIPFKHSSMIYRRAAIEKIGGYNEALKIKVDIDLFLRFQTEAMTVKKMNYPASYHRKHHNQVSRNRLEGVKVYSQLLTLYEPKPLIRYFLLSTRVPAELLKQLVRG